MKSKLYSLLQEGILKKPRKVLVTYRSLIEPVNADTTIGQFTLYGVISNDDPPIALSDTINLYPSTDADHPYRTITVDIFPAKEITNVFYTLINPDNAFNLNCTTNHIELISDQGNIPIGLGILEPEALAVTLITATGFTANWTEIEEATGYKIDISTDIEFGSFVGSYENYDIPSGATVSLSVTGLAENTCYFYRVRAYNATFTSLNSNEIHVGDVGRENGFYLQSEKLELIDTGIDSMGDECVVKFDINFNKVFKTTSSSYLIIGCNSDVTGTDEFSIKIINNSDINCVSSHEADNASMWALTEVEYVTKFNDGKFHTLTFVMNRKVSSARRILLDGTTLTITAGSNSLNGAHVDSRVYIGMADSYSAPSTNYAIRNICIKVGTTTIPATNEDYDVYYKGTDVFDVDAATYEITNHGTSGINGIATNVGSRQMYFITNTSKDEV